MHEIPSARWRLHEFTMTGFLQRQFIIVARSNDGRLRIKFVRSENVFGARHGNAVIPTRATFGQHQIITAVAFVKVRPFAKDVFLLQNFRHRPGEFALLMVVFLHNDAGKTVAILAKIPDHIDEPFATIVIVKQRRIKTN